MFGLSRLLPFYGEHRVWARSRLPGSAFPGLVSFDMFGEVVAPHESLATLLTTKALLSGVGAKVPLKLIGAGEALAAEEPVTDEGPLSSVPAQVRLQVRRLLIHFAALRDVTDVQSLFAKLQPPTVGLAVGTLAAAAAARGAQQTLGGSLQKSSDLGLVT